jgi:diguanylate cyclase (GGDEF)-like protein
MDASTILVFGAVILGLGSLGLLVVRLTNHRLDGLGWLGGAFATGGLSALLLIVNAHSPTLDILAADLCVILSFSLLHLAVLEIATDHVSVPPVDLALLVVMAVVDILYMSGHGTGRLRISTISFLVTIQCAQIAWLLYGEARNKVRSPAIFCATILSLFALFNLVRGLGVATGLLDRWHLTGDFLLTTFALYIAVALGLAFGFFWLTTTKFSEQLEDAAGTDPLTRLYNRRTFLRACEKELLLSTRYNRTFSILMLDLDHFKTVNDRFGHPVGDAALLAVVECMQRSVRGIDVLARWGGEEFAALLPNSSPESAFLVAERMRANIAGIELPLPDLYPGDPVFVRLTASIGIASYHPSDSIHSMLSRADRGLYLAKDLGRNRVLSASH